MLSAYLSFWLIATCLTLVDAENFCEVCTCSNELIDCTEMGLTGHINESDWPSNDSQRFTEARFDKNNFVRVMPFPPLALTRLSLSHNRIVRIEIDAFLNLTNLTELDLSNNQLTSTSLVGNVFEGKFLPDEYKPLHYLTKLKLGNNALHTLHGDLFEHTPNIKELSLDGNPFHILDSETVTALSSLPFLEVLDLSYIELKELPDYVFHTPAQLRVLNLTGNLLTKVPQVALSYTHKLEELHFCENPVTVIDNINGFKDLKYLRVLHLTYMQNLTHIDEGALSNLPALEEVYISHNYMLKDISPYAFSWRQRLEESEQWPNIKKLSLQYNHLGSLDRHLLGHWDTLEYLNLRGNPWICDCENQWMVATMIPSVEKLITDQYNELVCAEPIEMRSRKLHELTVHHYHMRCLDADGNHPEKDAKILIGVLVGVLLAVPITIGALLLLRRTQLGASLFSRRYGPADYSRAFYSRADSGEFNT